MMRHPRDEWLGARIKVVMLTVSEEHGKMQLPLWGDYMSRCGSVMNLTCVRQQMPDGSYRDAEDLQIDHYDPMVVDITRDMQSEVT